MPCKAGFYSESGVECKACPINRHSEQGARACDPCAAGTIDGDHNASTACVACKQVSDFSGCSDVAGCDPAAGKDNECVDCKDGLALVMGSCQEYTIRKVQTDYQVHFDHLDDRTKGEMKLLLREIISVLLGAFYVNPGDVVMELFTQQAHEGWVNITAQFVLGVSEDEQKRIDKWDIMNRPLPAHFEEIYGVRNFMSQSPGEDVRKSSDVPYWSMVLVAFAVFAVVVVAFTVHVCKTRYSRRYPAKRDDNAELIAVEGFEPLFQN